MRQETHNRWMAIVNGQNTPNHIEDTPAITKVKIINSHILSRKAPSFISLPIDFFTNFVIIYKIPSVIIIPITAMTTSVQAIVFPYGSEMENELMLSPMLFNRRNSVL